MYLPTYTKAFTPFSSSSNWDGDDLSEGPLFDFPITYPYDNEELGQYPLPDDDISLDIPNDNFSKSNKVMVIKWKTQNTTLLKQFQALKEKYHTAGTEFQNLTEKYHTAGTVPKSRKTQNTTLLKQFQNLEKLKIPHCWNSSKI